MTESTVTLPEYSSSSESYMFTSIVNTKDHEEQLESIEENFFVNEYAEIQYESVISLVSSLEYLNLDHMNYDL